MNFDSVLDDVGGSGWWQLYVSLLLWAPSFFGGVHVLMFSFTGLEPSNGFRCKVDGCDKDDFAFGDVPSDIFKRKSDGTIDYCSYRGYTKLDNGSCVYNSTQFISCKPSDEYAYAPFEFESTVVTEMDLVCDRQGRVAWVGSAYMVGLMVGSYLSGALADKYGRKKSLLVGIILSSGGSLVGAFMPEYFSYLATRVITAIGAQNIFMNAFSTTVEIFGKDKVSFLPWPLQYKTVAGVMIQAPFAVGMALLSTTASFISDWATLQWTTSVATFIQLLLWIIIPESPRWLVASKKMDEAKKVVEKAARMNGKKNYVFDISNTIKMEDIPKKDEDVPVNNTKYGIKDLFNPALIKISLVLMIIWPITTLGYYGITFSMASLNDNLFLSFILSSLIEIPSYLAVLIFMDVWGRKPLFSLSLLVSGLMCILCGVLDEGTLRTVLAMVGKFFASSSFALVYMYTAELFPTTIRSTGVGVCSFMARIGGISAPQIAISLPKVASASAPFYVMGSLSIAGGVFSLLLPETLGSNLPETMEDVSRISAQSKPVWKCAKFKQTT